MKKYLTIGVAFLLLVALILIITVCINQNESVYLKMAEKYVNSQIVSVQNEQNLFIEAGLPQKNGGSNQNGLVIEKARIDDLEETVTYKGYKAFRYKCSYLPNDAGLVVEVGSWQITEDEWLCNNSSVYLIFSDTDTPQLLGEMVCEFSPAGYSEGFYETFDLWLSEQN